MTREEVKKYLMNMREAINALEQELCEDISEDGTLTVNVEDGTKVSRMFVCGDNHFGGLYYPEQEPCEDCVSREEAILVMCRNCADWQTCKLNCIRVQAMRNIEKLPSVQPKQRTGYISIDDVMSVFDDFMCGEVDEDGTETFLEMLKDKAESEELKMTRFSNFTDEELDVMESAFCNEGLGYVVEEIRMERRYRERQKLWSETQEE